MKVISLFILLTGVVFGCGSAPATETSGDALKKAIADSVLLKSLNDSKSPDFNRIRSAAVSIFESEAKKVSDCKAAMDAYNKTRNEFSLACSSAGLSVLNLGPESKKTGDATDCALTIGQCAYCATGAAAYSPSQFQCREEETPEEDEDDSAKKKATSTAFDQMSADQKKDKEANDKMITTRRNQYLNCPPIAQADLDTLKKEALDGKKDMREQQKDLEDAQADAEKAQAKFREKMTRLQDTAEEIQQTAKEDTDRVQMELEEQKAKLAKVVGEMQRQINLMQNNVQQMINAKYDASIAYQDTIARLNQSCHANALMKVEEERKLMIKLIEANVFTKGDFSTFMSGVGKSMRDKLKEKAARAYRDCISDRSYNESVDAAKRAQESALRKADTAIQAQMKDIESIQGEIKNLQTKEQSRLVENATKKLTQVNDRLMSKMKSLSREASVLSQNATQEAEQNARKVQRISSNLTDDRLDYEFQRGLLTAARDLGKTPIKGEDYRKATGLYSSYRTDMEAAARVCCDPSSKEENKDQQCEAACNAMSLGFDNLPSVFCPPKTRYGQIFELQQKPGAK